MRDRDEFGEPRPRARRRRADVRGWGWAWGVAGLVVGGGVVGLVAIVAFGLKSRGDAATRLTVHRATAVVNACRTYRGLHPDRGYPPTLADLSNPPPGDGPVIDAASLTDGWGNPFRYALVPTAAGLLDAYVWAEHTRDGRTTVHGAKITADGVVVQFGQPDD